MSDDYLVYLLFIFFSTFTFRNKAYIEWYNHERRHSGIDNRRPVEVMMGLKHPTYWPFKELPQIELQQDKTTQTLSSSLAA